MVYALFWPFLVHMHTIFTLCMFHEKRIHYYSLFPSVSMHSQKQQRAKLLNFINYTEFVWLLIEEIWRFNQYETIFTRKRILRPMIFQWQVPCPPDLGSKPRERYLSNRFSMTLTPVRCGQYIPTIPTLLVSILFYIPTPSLPITVCSF